MRLPTCLLHIPRLFLGHRIGELIHHASHTSLYYCVMYRPSLMSFPPLLLSVISYFSITNERLTINHVQTRPCA
jgi:hypothetical protein